MGPGGELVSGFNKKNNGAEAPGTSTAPRIATSLRLITDRELQQGHPDAQLLDPQSTLGTKSVPNDPTSKASHEAALGKNHPYTDEAREHGADFGKSPPVKVPSRTDSRSSTVDGLFLKDPLQDPESSPSRLPLIPQVPSFSHSLASLSLDSQAPLSSLASSPISHSHRSFRPSDEDSLDGAASQAVASDSEDEAGPPPELQDSAPQLIMPSIKMPSRRPFTTRGKSVGRLKIMLAGDSGSVALGLLFCLRSNAI